MGGEPTVHPDFIEMTEAAVDYYKIVLLFTNGTRLNQIKTRKIMEAYDENKFGIIVNGYAAPDADYSDFDHIMFHFVVPAQKHEFNRIVRKVKRFARMPYASFSISGDTNVNLFNTRARADYRKLYVKFWKKVIAHVSMRCMIDHPFPHCFWTQQMIDELHGIDVGLIHQLKPNCCDRNIGLIDTDLNIQYCNQTRIPIGSIIGKTLLEVDRMIRTAPQKKMELLNSRCQLCPSAVICKAACWFEHARE